MIYTFELKFKKISGIGKNNFGVTRNGIHYPKKNFINFRGEAIRQIIKQLPSNFRTIKNECKLNIIYCPADKRTRDATAIIDAIFHIFEKAGIIENDNQIKQIEYSEKTNQDFTFLITLQN